MISVVSVADGDRDRVLAALGLIDTGQLAVNDEGALRCQERNGRVTVIALGEHAVSRKAMEALSDQGEVVGAREDPGSKACGAWGWRNGQEQWAVTYRLPEGWIARGQPPAAWDRLLARETAYGNPPDWDLPMSLAAILDGAPEEEGEIVRAAASRLVEPMRAGREGQQQVERRVLARRLEARIVGELYPEAERLGFECAADREDYQELYAHGRPNAFVRLGASPGAFIVYWGVEKNKASLMLFACTDPRFGSSANPPRALGLAGGRESPLKSLFGGRKLEGDASIDKAVEDGRTLLHAMDAWLKNRTPHPWIEPE